MIEDFFIGSVHSREEMIILKFAHLSKFSSEKEFSRGVISSVSVLYSIMKLKTKKRNQKLSIDTLQNVFCITTEPKYFI